MDIVEEAGKGRRDARQNDSERKETDRNRRDQYRRRLTSQGAMIGDGRRRREWAFIIG